MSYDLVADKIEVRASKENNNPRYVVNGTAMVANKKDIYKYAKNRDGSYKTLKSMFTPRCIESIKEQSKHKKLFVDGMHELAINTNVKSILKGKLTADEEKRIGSLLKAKMLPLAKLTDININEDSLNIETELNPVFRDVDQDHQKYFDAVWYSLEEKYLNGISVNFANPQVIEEQGETKINEIDVLGFSYVDNPAYHGNTIQEVCIRAMQEGIQTRNTGDETKMDEKAKELEKKEKEIEEERKSLEAQKAELQKSKEEADKQAEIKKQSEEQAKVQKDLDDKAEALKQAEDDNAKLKAELDVVKSKVKEVPPPSQPPKAVDNGDDFYEKKLKEITKGHDETIETIKNGKEPPIDRRMEGFGEAVFLSAQAGDQTAGLDPKNAEYVKEHRLLDKSGSDIKTSPQR